MALDRPWARIGKEVARTKSVPIGSEVRVALVTVNFSTLRWLKLMMLTLSEQRDIGLISNLIVVDNGSRDGSAEFLSDLNGCVPILDVVYRRHRLFHGPAMRAGVRRLDQLDAGNTNPSNVLLFCDSDVIFRDPTALSRLTDPFLIENAALVGECRRGPALGPNIQASCFAVRRDVYSRRDVAPLVHNGAPARALQQSVEQLGLNVVDLPSNHGGLILHRGRSGVDAARVYRPGHQYASARRNTPHFMGVPNGESIWSKVERRHQLLLEPGNHAALIERLALRFET